MKYLKLFGIFVAAVVVLAVAFIWTNSSSSGESRKYASEDVIDVNQWRQSLDAEWINAGGWDAAIYAKQFKAIEQKRGSKLISKTSYDNARQALFQTGVNQLCESFSKHLKQADYSDVKVQEMRRGVDTIVKYERIGNITNQPRLAHIVDVYNLYTDVKSFVGKSHAIYPKFNTTSLNWTSFNKRQESILKEARNYRNDSRYGEMNTLSSFINGLDETKLKTTTEGHRASFYSGLSDQIIAHFEYLEYGVANPDKLTSENLKKIGELWNQFDNENKGPGNKNLLDFKTRYNKALKEKEKNANRTH